MPRGYCRGISAAVERDAVALKPELEVSIAGETIEFCDYQRPPCAERLS
jgi:hypothetical protein